jgi:hypothetical protein
LDSGRRQAIPGLGKKHLNCTLAKILIFVKHLSLYTFIAALLALSSCSENGGGKYRGPIRLGDSSMIVTETDSQYLKDDVMDVAPVPVASRVEAAAETEPVTSVAEPAPAQEPVAVSEPASKPDAGGFAINFGKVKLTLAGAKLKDGRKQQPEKDNGLTYVGEADDMARARIQVQGAKEVKIRQRYQSRVEVRTDMGTLDLRNMGLYTSSWSDLKGTNSYALNTLSRPEYKDVNQQKIRAAAEKELKRRKTSSRNTQTWLNSIKGMRNADDKPGVVVLDNVQWQISGTDAAGNNFHKNIRVDLH